MIAIVVALALQAATPPPTYLVERIISSGPVTRRVSVFRDGTAVLVERRGKDEPRVVHTTLTDVELRALQQVVEEGYAGLEEAAPAEAPGDAAIELRLAPPGRAPLIVHFRLSAVPTLGAVRIGQAMDALETRLASRQPAREDLSAWVPRVGDRVELEDGRVVEVTELLSSESGLLVRVRVGDGPVAVFFTVDELRRLAARRVP